MRKMLLLLGLLGGLAAIARAVSERLGADTGPDGSYDSWPAVPTAPGRPA
ncbi:MAG TPA: hypothetical protein VMR97_14650 [Acidimicrobiales bacterium]|nr:hypothetical protein [Acidimicrobiales bacterium]